METGEYKYIFLITFDALRGDHVGAINPQKAILTPKINSFSKKSLIFTKAFSNGPITNESFPSIFTSTYFLMHRGYFMNKKFKTVAELLQKKGYRTVGFHSNPYLSKKFGWNKGFQEFYDFMNISVGGMRIKRKQNSMKTKLLKRILTKTGVAKNQTVKKWIKLYGLIKRGMRLPYVDGNRLLRLAEKRINHCSKQKQKCFVWIHFMDTHIPFAPPEKWLPKGFNTRKEALLFNYTINFNQPSKKEIKKLYSLYQATIRYVDHLFGNFINHIDELGILNKSLLIISSDHGEAFFEHGIYGHTPGNFYNEVVHVPLIIYNRGENNGIIDSPVSLLDITPTMVTKTSEKSHKQFYGKNLLEKINKNGERAEFFIDSAENYPEKFTYNFRNPYVAYINYPYKVMWYKRNETIDIKMYNLENDWKEKEDLISQGLNEAEKKILKKALKKIKRHILECKIKRKKLL